METINIHEAKTHLSRLLERVASGEEIIIAKAGKPIARLIAYGTKRGQRRGGQWRGMVNLGDDFDAPLPRSVAEAFRGEHA